MAQAINFSRLRNNWFTPVNNSPLIVFRILFGAVMFMEFGKSITQGWVEEVYIKAPYRFTFIGFEFLQHMNGEKMYYYFGLGCAVALMFALGLLYRFSSIMLALLWTAVYFSQKAHYNNHYYLMVLICWLMVLVPAHRRTSLDVKRGIVKPTNECYNWCIQLFVIQIAVVYTFAAIAKLYPDWLQAMPAKIWFVKKQKHPQLGFLFRSDWFPYFVSYSGILFDFLIVPALLWRRTRLLAVAAMLVFHQFNKLTFGIGVFPYLAMSLNVFFFPGKTFDNTIGIETKKLLKFTTPIKTQAYITAALCIYITWQVLTPFRHHLYKGDVVFTEEGHRMAWRMMLRSKKGDIVFTVKDKNSDSVWTELPRKHMLKYQARNVATKPDFIWQFAQRLKDEYKEKGYDVQVFANSQCSVNGRPRKPLVDSTVDIAAEPWKHFAHHHWVLTDYK